MLQLFIRFAEFTEFNESSTPFRKKNSISTGTNTFSCGSRIADLWDHCAEKLYRYDAFTLMELITIPVLLSLQMQLWLVIHTGCSGTGIDP